MQIQNANAFWVRADTPSMNRLIMDCRETNEKEIPVVGAAFIINAVHYIWYISSVV